MPQTLEKKLANIEQMEDGIRKYFAQAMIADPTIYIVDLVIIGALKRTLALADGFRGHIRERNFTCAGALLRLQLDTALRLYGGSLYGKPSAYADAIFRGKRIDKLKDRRGQRMTDSYLAEQMSRNYPWVKKMYVELCDFIHFSNRPFFAAVEKLGDKDGLFNFVIGAKDPPRPDSDYFEIVDAFTETLRVTSDLAARWHATIHRFDKSRPAAS